MSRGFLLSSIAYTGKNGYNLQILNWCSSLKTPEEHVQRFRLGQNSVRTMASQTLTLDTLNPHVIKMEYAVRGALAIRAGELIKELEKGAKKPFDEVIRANLGDAHAMLQPPITFIRQLLATIAYPALLQNPDIPSDVKEKAKAVLGACRGGSSGAYTDSPGIELIRKQVAKYIEKRDGIPSNWQNVVLTSGASDGIKNILKLMICTVNGKMSGVLVPIPQYPFYSATIAEFGMHLGGYYLDEDHNWGLDINELERALGELKQRSHPRLLVVINPGNPTGQVLTRQNIEDIIKFAHKERLFLFADEVYQHNVYAKGSKFHSFKKVMTEMGDPYSKMELASFMSASKGYMGECGLRGGYAEVINMDPKVKAMYMKALSAMLCPSVLGQSGVYAFTNPPEQGDPSYDLFAKEKAHVLDTLKGSAEMVVKTFNTFQGFKCNEVQGAMYAFPRFELPPKALEAAKKRKLKPDVFYAFELLENTGICVIPGSGFGQKEGTYHFRTTILPRPAKLKKMLPIFDAFHKEFEKSHAVLANSTVYVSLTFGIDGGTGEFAAGGVMPEFIEAMRNLEFILDEAGSCLEKVVKLTIILHDIRNLCTVNKILRQRFGDPPARTIYQAALPMGATVGVEAVALCGRVNVPC